MWLLMDVPGKGWEGMPGIVLAPTRSDWVRVWGWVKGSAPPRPHTHAEDNKTPPPNTLAEIHSQPIIKIALSKFGIESFPKLCELKMA